MFFVSDQTGITAETMGHSLMTQFDGIEFRQVTVPFISTVDKAIEAVRKIDLVGKHEGVRPIVFSTLVQEDVRNVVRGSTGFFLDFFDAFLAPLENELKTQSSHAMSRTHRNADTHSYAMRIDATNFALANDDGSVLRDYERADVILIGVSRSGQDADVSVSGDAVRDFRRELSVDRGRSRIAQAAARARAAHAQAVRPDDQAGPPAANPQRAASRQPLFLARQVAFEVRAAESLFERHGVPFIDATEVSIEEISSRILDRTGIERRLRP